MDSDRARTAGGQGVHLGERDCAAVERGGVGGADAVPAARAARGRARRGAARRMAPATAAAPRPLGGRAGPVLPTRPPCSSASL